MVSVLLCRPSWNGHVPFEKKNKKKTTKNKNEQNKTKREKTARGEQIKRPKWRRVRPFQWLQPPLRPLFNIIELALSQPIQCDRVSASTKIVGVCTCIQHFFFFFSFFLLIVVFVVWDCLLLSLTPPPPPHGLLSLYSLRLRFRFCVPVSLQRIIAWGGRLLLRKRIPCVNLRFRLRVYFLAIQRRRRLRRQTHIDEDCFVVRSIRIFRNAC